MSIRVALYHRSHYQYDRPTELGPQIVRLRPAPHCRTPINSYSLRVTPNEHFINWQQDPYGNYLARLVFGKPTNEFKIEVDLVTEMTVINPFDFFLEPDSEMYPFEYSPTLLKDLLPFLQLPPLPSEGHLAKYLLTLDYRHRKTIDFLVELNRKLKDDIEYVIRMEPGVQSCEETLGMRKGSCRDSGWLLVNILRQLGFAARFVSGYLIQLTADVKPLDGPAGTDKDFTDLHAWAEVFLPGAGWIGLDPTSGLLAGEGHIPLACTPEPISAAPITGTTSESQCDFSFDMQVTRIHEDPRVTKPYTEEQWQAIRALGKVTDERLAAGDVRLTMGGEPTFVSIDNMEGVEWRTEALGSHKRRLAGELILRLKDRFSYGGLLHYGQGKQYPGEPLPRWALRCYWRTDGEPIWNNEALFANPLLTGASSPEDARQFTRALAERLNVNADHVSFGYEDALYYTWKERRLPTNVDVRDSRLENEEDRARMARVFERGITAPVGCVLPLRRIWWTAESRWESGEWAVRSDEMFLIPGDSPMGLRLPLDSLLWYENVAQVTMSHAADPMEARQRLPLHDQFHSMVAARGQQAMQQFQLTRVATGSGNGNGHLFASTGNGQFHDVPSNVAPPGSTVVPRQDPSNVVRTALCVEPRGGVLHVFMPPLDRAEDYLELITAVEDTAAAMRTQVVIEGYLPPSDPRLDHVKVTPDPGVIEVNVHPASNWDQLVDITEGVYEDARQSRLGTEKFDLDGAHTGTGGGNHVVLGGPTPSDSPFLRRPDLLRSLVAYWHNHPALSYLLSGTFIGPTSQSPRVDEGRRDAAYELQIAFEQIPKNGNVPPWLVDRVFRHLLVDATGNTHRSEFCIDKLFTPDMTSGRLGLVEFRAFEMPPHPQMSLAQQLLLRCLVTRFWDQPYEERLVNWNTSLHDGFLLPHFVRRDFEDVVEETRQAGYDLDANWFAPHFEFRFPVIGEFCQRGVQVELRKAIEPWYVLGEEPAGGYTARYVDSSVERLQVKVTGMTDPRHVITCNGRKVPLHPTGTEGEYVAGVRYRAWQPPSCLHPTIPVDTPLVFDLMDLWLKRSLGGATYHVGHPGGLNPTVFPVNAVEAESRRAGRFFKMGHRVGPLAIPAEERNSEFPLTLDLRRGRANSCQF